MLKNYFKSAIRNLLKRRAYAFINIAGLAVGITCCLLIALYVWEEWQFDAFHQQADQVYRVAATFQTTQEENELAISPSVLSALLREGFAEVEQATRFYTEQLVFEHENRRFMEDRMLFADTTFFDVFTFPLRQGNAETALEAPFSVVLTPAIALKYFGNDNPIGQTLSVDGQHTFSVTGVTEPLPSNSHIQFDVLISMSSWEPLGKGDLSNYFGQWMYTYVRLAPNVEAEQFQEQLVTFMEGQINQNLAQVGMKITLVLEPLPEIYLYSKRLGQVGDRTGDPNTLYVFTLIAVFILLIACINFMNLSTARSAERAKEVGVRKVVGADWRGLMGQFLTESIVLSLISGILALLFAELLMPSFEVLAGRGVDATVLTNGPVVAILLVTTILVGVLAGVYPALVLSRFRPVVVLKGAFRNTKHGTRLRKGLVIVQFGITAALIAGTFIVFTQLQYLREHDLGFSKDQKIIINLGADGISADRTKTMMQRLAQHGAVQGVTAASDVPFSGYSISVMQIERGDGIEQQSSINQFSIGEDFLDEFEMEIIAGRPFSEERGDTRLTGMIINEAAVPFLGYTSPDEVLGRSVTFGPGSETNGEIIGVVRDFNYVSLHENIEPLALRFAPDPYAYIVARLSTEHISRTLGELEQIWAELEPHGLFDYSFFDESFAELYQADQQFGRLFGVFATLAILIACLGLFGLAAFTIQQRTKEIGVRKVLGATVSSIVMLLSKDFVRLVVVAMAVATPIAYFGLEQWLNTFAFRVDIGWLSFVLAGILSLTIALGTISYQAIRAATANPIDALRYE